MSGFEIFPDDTFITSFPKSGNTWVRFFAANLILDNGNATFVNLDQLVPDIYKVAPEVLARIQRPRFLKSHNPFTNKYPRVLYLVRDVRSVVSSHYRQRLRMGKIPQGLPIIEFTKMFVVGETSGCGLWDDHIKRWMTAARESDLDFLSVRYENLLNHGPQEFRKIAQFLKLERTDAQIENAMMRCSFERMKQLESEAGKRWLEKTHARDMSIPFMYSGKADSWKTDLDEESQELLRRSYRSMLEELGYEI